MKLLSSVFLFLLVVVPTATCKSSSAVEDACRSFAADHPSIGYDYCIKTFQQADDKASAAAADLRGLAAIAARMAGAKANATAARVAALTAMERDARRRDRLSVCAEVYSDAVDQLAQAAADIVRGEGGDDAVTQLSAAMDAPGTCEDAFGEADDTSPLAAEDAEFKKLATIALAFAASLTTAPPPPSTPIEAKD
ncbi:unnamed protein product [Urochloa humidicola]